MGTKVLVTGATGLLGRALVRYLAARGDEVRALVRPETASQPDRIAQLTAEPGVEIAVGNLTDGERLTDGADLVYHLALIYQPDQPFGTELIARNVDATDRLLKASVASGVRRFIFTSSIATYGWNHPRRAWPLTEQTALWGNGNYARTKIQTENLIRHLAWENDLDFSILRITSTLGPGISKFERYLEQLLRRPSAAFQAAPLDPTLEHGRISHWVHLVDAVNAIVLAGDHPAASREVFNVAGERAATRAEIARMLRVGSAGSRATLPTRSSLPPSAPLEVYDTTKAGILLGFEPSVGLEAGIAEVAKGLRWGRPQTLESPPRWRFAPALNAGRARL